MLKNHPYLSTKRNTYFLKMKSKNYDFDIYNIGLLCLKRVVLYALLVEFINIFMVLKGLCLIRVMSNFDFLDPGR
jgi:hypothetical protein